MLCLGSIRLLNKFTNIFKFLFYPAVAKLKIPRKMLKFTLKLLLHVLV
jgi:hypothetical protein